MPYVKRDGDGRITAVYQTAVEGADERITADDEELREFLTGGEQETAAKREFMESDLGLARVLEDLIGLLIEKGIFMFTDLPPAAQQKLLERSGLRKEFAYVETLFSPGEEDEAFSPDDVGDSEDGFL
ncbi:MAG: hypothetical protein IIC04_00875 [Proteobacteria bacterium]|nr:hypothetical protein [Pseudomonadota bacterium]